jgi:hypothetical protein
MFRLNVNFAQIRKAVVSQFTKARAYLAVELAGSAAILIAIAHYNWPAALATGGLAAIVAVERQTP